VLRHPFDRLFTCPINQSGVVPHLGNVQSLGPACEPLGDADTARRDASTKSEILIDLMARYVEGRDRQHITSHS